MEQTEGIVCLSGQTESESLEKTVLGVVCRIKGRVLFPAIWTGFCEMLERN